jgi:hypothetical protein
MNGKLREILEGRRRAAATAVPPSLCRVKHGLDVFTKRTPYPASSGAESPAGRRCQLDSTKTDFGPLVMARITTGPNNNHPVNQLNEVFDSIRRTIRQADTASPIHQVCNAIVSRM